MLQLNGAVHNPWTLGQLVSGIARHVIPFVLALVTTLAEVSVPPAKPLGDVATELAFEFNELSAMLCAVFDPCPHTLSGALSTNQLLWFKHLVLIVLILLIGAVLHPSEVRRLAFKAHIVAELGHCVSLQIVVVNEVLLVLESVVLIQAFVLCSLQRLLLYLGFYQFACIYFYLEYWAVRRLYSGFTEHATQVVENDSGSCPLLFDSGHDAV